MWIYCIVVQLELRHSRLAIESRANYVIILRYKFFGILQWRSNQRKLWDNNLTAGRINRSLPRKAAPVGHKMREFTHTELSFRTSFKYVQHTSSP